MKNLNLNFSLLLWNYLLILKILPVSCFKDPKAAILTLKMFTRSRQWFIPEAACVKLFGSSRSNILSREGLTAAKRNAKERPREKVTGGGIQSQEQMESVFTHTPPLPWHNKDNCVSPPPLLPPPPWVLPHWDTKRPQRWISVMTSVWRLWVCELILDSDGDHFLFSPIFGNFQWNLGGRRYFVDANICDVFCMAGRYK